jgi:hypothetical protein
VSGVLAAATVVVVLGLVGVIAGFLWSIGTMVLGIADLLSSRIAPGANAVAAHVSAMAPSIRRLGAAIDELA